MITRICKYCNTIFTKNIEGKIRKFNGKKGFICDECKRKYKNNNNNIKRW
jgi:hypothetical protein